MSDWHATWPTRDEYDRAAKRWMDNVRDPDLRSASAPALMMGTLPRHYEGAGLYVTVYKTGAWQTRCFCSNIEARINPPADIVARYQAISTHICASLSKVPALVETRLLSQGIYVADAWRPVVKMKWITHATRLGSFVNTHHDNGALMRALAEEWRRMVLQLEEAEIAHGDLDVTNVLVQLVSGRPILRLVDYDNMWVPVLRGLQQTECGHEPFQHPHFFRPLVDPNPAFRPFDARMDRFAALVIYISLVALSIQPTLYLELQAREDERLLFSREDYEKPSAINGSIERIRRACGSTTEPYVRELIACLAEKRMPGSLREIAAHHSDAGSRISVPSIPSPPPMTRSLGVRTPRVEVLSDHDTRLHSFGNGHLSGFVSAHKGDEPTLVASQQLSQSSDTHFARSKSRHPKQLFVTLLVVLLVVAVLVLVLHR